MINKDFPFVLTVVITTFILKLKYEQNNILLCNKLKGRELEERERDQHLFSLAILLEKAPKTYKNIVKVVVTIMITVIFCESDQCQVLVGSLVQLWVTYFFRASHQDS